MSKLSHLDALGNAAMVDVSAKAVTLRTAKAKARVYMSSETLRLIVSGELPKGDVMATARIAGIMAAKRTDELIPLCHPLALSKISVDFNVDPGASTIDVTATAIVQAKTGVEMEAMTACAVACLTLYDMCKSVDRGMRIGDLRLVEKSGGKSGDYHAE